MKRLFLVGIALVSLFVIGCQKTPATTTAISSIDAFAKCLSGKWVKMYGTATCPHCQKQKALFGSSFQYINYTDCLQNPTACTGVSRVPTWEFKDGTTIQGEQDFAFLANKTNCKLP
jgi:glutaredoxin